jgi:hypothetical protein
LSELSTVSIQPSTATSADSSSSSTKPSTATSTQTSTALSQPSSSSTEPYTATSTQTSKASAQSSSSSTEFFTASFTELSTSSLTVLPTLSILSSTTSAQPFTAISIETSTSSIESSFEASTVEPEIIFTNLTSSPTETNLNISTASPIGTSNAFSTTEWNPTTSSSEATLPTKINQSIFSTSTSYSTFSTAIRSITTIISTTSISTRSTSISTAKTSHAQSSVSFSLTASLTLPDSSTDLTSFTNTVNTDKEENSKSSDKTLIAILFLSIVPGVFMISVIGILTFYFISKYSKSKITPRILNMEMYYIFL